MATQSITRVFQTRLLLTVLTVAIVPMIVVASILTSWFYNQAVEKSQTQLRSTARQVESGLNQILSITEQLAIGSAQQGDLKRALKSSLFAGRADQIAITLLESSSVVTGVYLYNEQEKQITSQPAGLMLHDLPQNRRQAPDQNTFIILKDQSFAKRHHELVTKEVPNLKSWQLESSELLLYQLPVYGLMNRKIGNLSLVIAYDHLAAAAQSTTPSGYQSAISTSKPALTTERESDIVVRSINLTGMERPLYLEVKNLTPPSIASLWQAVLPHVVLAVAMVALCTLLGFWAARFLTLGYSAVVADHERNVSALERAKISSELKALRSQMNPHFLFNAMNSIGTLIPTAPSTALESLQKLATVYRSVLTGSKSQTVPLSQEKKILSEYLALESLRFGDRLTYDIQLPEQSIHLPGMILQTLVENAIKYGIAPSRTGGHITVSMEPVKDQYKVTITNTGEVPKSVPSLAEITNKGTGLANTIERLQLLYPDQHHFAFKVEDGKTIVSFTLSGERL